MTLNVSVVIPVYNDPDGLRATLESLVVQDFPSGKFEIIVADNGSTDNTIEVVKKFVQKYPKLIRIVIEDNIQSSYAARNKGVKASKAPIIAFIDADMIVKRDWLSKAIESMLKHKAEYLACNVQIYTKGRENLFAKYNRLTGFPIKEYIEKNKFAPTCCIFIRKKVFEEIGYFDSRLVSGGDLEFGNRVYNSGKELFFDPNIIMYHPARSSFCSLLKKSFRIGKGIAQLHKYYPERYGCGIINIIKAFLPPIPWKLKNRFRRWSGLKLYEKFIFYLIYYSATLSSGVGRLIFWILAKYKPI